MKRPRFVRVKSGHIYVYAWRGGPRVATFDPRQTPTLSREIRARIAEAWAEAETKGAKTLDGLIRDWRRSPEYNGLAPNTRATWEVPLARIGDKWGKYGLELWNDPRMVGKVVGWRDSMASTPRAADIGVTVLARLLEWGRLRARVQINVASGVPMAERRSCAHLME